MESNESKTMQPRKSSRPNDVTLIVGGEKFYDNSTFLRSIGDFFETAFMTEMPIARDPDNNNYQFEFPDRNPDSWGLIKSFVTPFKNAELTDKNWEEVLSWCSELFITTGIVACDEFLQAKLDLTHVEMTHKAVSQSLKYARASLQFLLPISNNRSLEVVARVMNENPSWLSRDDWNFFCKHMLENVDESMVSKSNSVTKSDAPLKLTRLD